MKKLSIFLILAALTVSLGAACIVEPAPHVRGHARVSYVAPPIRVTYVVRSGVRVYRVPRGIRPGDVIIIDSKRCVVRKVRRNRVKVVYPSGTRVWINVEFR